jgi:hypothetical protein
MVPFMLTVYLTPACVLEVVKTATTPLNPVLFENVMNDVDFPVVF